MADGDTVAVLGYVRRMVRATARHFKSGYAHVLTVRDGTLISYRAYRDAAPLLAAYQGA